MSVGKIPVRKKRLFPREERDSSSTRLSKSGKRRQVKLNQNKRATGCCLAGPSSLGMRKRPSFVAPAPEITAETYTLRGSTNFGEFCDFFGTVLSASP
ncbi:hypothetical protein KM043_004145 [Ampulex compressa]|nr:hypothetical protein KM043_004145 [Ampulex compressa]